MKISLLALVLIAFAPAAGTAAPPNYHVTHRFVLRGADGGASDGARPDERRRIPRNRAGINPQATTFRDRFHAIPGTFAPLTFQP